MIQEAFVPLSQKPIELKHTLNHCLEKLAKDNEGGLQARFDIFNGNIRYSFLFYLTRMMKFMNGSISNYIIALIFLYRIIKRRRFFLSQKNMHKSYLTALTLASKYNEDFCYSNSYYSMVGGISLKELNRMQSYFLQLLSYETYVNQAEFKEMSQFLQEYYQKNEREIRFRVEIEKRQLRQKLERERLKQLQRKKIIQKNREKYRKLRRIRKLFIRKFGKQKLLLRQTFDDSLPIDRA